jgi:molecular chaperone Hsp33
VQTDYVQRFLFENLDIRGRLVCLSGAWLKMLEGRGYPARIAALLGQATGLAVLLGANQKGVSRVTLQVIGSGPVRLLVVDCTSELQIRGMVQHDALPQAPGSDRSLLGDGRLALTFEDVAKGRPERSEPRIYQSLVPLEGETLERILEGYLSQSEQVPALLRLHVAGDALCGLLLEKMPEADARDARGWERVTKLAQGLSLESARQTQPYDLLTRLFADELMRVLRLYPVEYRCPYDVENVKNMLRGLGRKEVESILAEHGEVRIRNEMCNHEYRFDRAAVEALFA